MINTHIQWAEHTWNPWLGCRKVSAGCKYCYMHRSMHPNNPSVVRMNTPNQFFVPMRLKGSQMVFICSMSDFYIEEADKWRAVAWEIFRVTPHLTYQILTKRPERIAQCLPDDWGPNGYSNVWLGTSIEDQSAIERMIILSQLKTFESNFKLFISAEPLIGEIDFTATQKLIDAFQKMDWIIVGGESGNAPVGTPNVQYCYRPCDLNWIDKIILDCKSYNIPFFLKQVGNHLARKYKLKDKKGGEIIEWDKNYQIRQWPW